MMTGDLIRSSPSFCGIFHHLSISFNLEVLLQALKRRARAREALNRPLSVLDAQVSAELSVHGDIELQEDIAEISPIARRIATA